MDTYYSLSRPARETMTPARTPDAIIDRMELTLYERRRMISSETFNVLAAEVAELKRSLANARGTVAAILG